MDGFSGKGNAGGRFFDRSRSRRLRVQLDLIDSDRFGDILDGLLPLVGESQIELVLDVFMDCPRDTDAARVG